MTDLTPEALADLDAKAAAVVDAETHRAFTRAASPDVVRALIAALAEARAEVERLRCEHCGRLDCDWIGDITRARADAAEARLAAVRALHCAVPVPGDDDDGECDQCGQDYPCATVRALDGE